MLSAITLPFTFKIREWEDDLEVLLPSDAFTGIDGLFPAGEADVEIKFMAIKWKTHPLLHHLSGHLIETPPFTFELLNSQGDPYPV